MSKVDYEKPASIEKRILRILSERDHFDFINLRASFPIHVTSVEKKCNDLISLGLITKEKINEETQYSLTDKGAQVITHGFDKWIRLKVFKEIKDSPYIVTKSTPGIEIFTIRNLESEGKIYIDGKFYKVVPGENLDVMENSIDVPSGDLNEIIDKVINDIYIMKIPFHQMEIEKTHKHEIRHVMNYLDENEIVVRNSDPVKLTALGVHIYHIGHEKWRKEKDREQLLGEKIKNAHLQNRLEDKSNKNSYSNINEWYSKHEKLINLVVALVTVFGFIIALYQIF